MTVTPPPNWILRVQCPDAAGVLAAVLAFLCERGASFNEVSAYADPQTGRFFNRLSFIGAPDGAPLQIERIKAELPAFAVPFGIQYTLTDASKKMPVVIAVSKFGHALNDLLHRWSIGELPVEIRAVVSNHETLRSPVEWHGVPFHYLPTTPGQKRQQEQQILDIVSETASELLVLARYMQILSDETSRELSGRCINIHHSFLPSFKGAKPYHQAHDRGVKLIGATAHYVTADLDEGPIIEQGVERVDHAATADQLVAIGRDTECQVLARSVRWHAEGRVSLNGRRTVVFK